MVEADRKLLLTLRKLLDEIEKDSSMSALEVMWEIRSHTCNQAEIPQAIFPVGDQLASVIYLEECSVVGHDRGGCNSTIGAPATWEVQLGGDEHQFDTFEEVLSFIERSRRSRLIELVGR